MSQAATARLRSTASRALPAVLERALARRNPPALGDHRLPRLGDLTPAQLETLVSLGRSLVTRLSEEDLLATLGIERGQEEVL